MKRLLLLAVCGLWALTATFGHGQSRVDPKTIASEVSASDIETTLHAIDVDRTSGSAGERQAFDYLARKLAEYGIKHTEEDIRIFLSWPGRAELRLPGQESAITGKTPVFAWPTPPEGLEGEVVMAPAITTRADASLAFGPEVRGRIAVVPGAVAAEAALLAARNAGALAVIQIDEMEKLHEDIATSIWGTPTTESAARIPTLPFICIRKSDGDKLKASPAASGAKVRLVTEVTRGWRSIPIVVADVPGRTADFVMITTHVDAWYRGMTDTAGSVASILDMARVLQKHQRELERGVRFAWWTGHSFGRYAGSTWYTDRHWNDLDEHCVAYTNLDGPGRRGSRVDAVSAGGWPGMAEYSREFATRLTGKQVPAGRGGSRPFRPGRDSDSSYQGIGVPFFSIGVPGPPQGHPDVEPVGRISYWHAEDDTFDKLDMKALALDTQYRVAQLYDLATMKVLPHRIGPIAAAYVQALKDLEKPAQGTFDLAPATTAADALAQAATMLDQAAKPTEPGRIAAFNRLVVRLSHRLNSTLYTKAGRFDQDPATDMPIFPLLARVKELPTLPADGDEFGFLQTELLRARNAVVATLREAAADIDAYLGGK